MIRSPEPSSAAQTAQARAVLDRRAAEQARVRRIGVIGLGSIGLRMLGEVKLQAARIEFAQGGVAAEHFAAVRLDAGGVPITITGTTMGAGPEVNRITFWGEEGSMRIRDLHTLEVATDDRWRAAYPAPDNPELDTYLRQLDNLAALLDGRAHTLADFRAAFATQKLIEGILDC